MARLQRSAGRFASIVALGLVLSAPSVWAEAQPKPAPPSPKPSARALGVEPGNAPMGWRFRSNQAEGGEGLQRLQATPTGVLGIDVASWQGKVNWARYRSQGKVFAYVKATEGTSYRNPYFSSQYNGAAAAGFIRGAYHFANPAGKSGAAQADYFIANGGGWTKDGKTLPGVLDVEYNPYGKTCYGISKKKMRAWITAFVSRYKARTGRDAVIYTTTDWWTRCTGNTKKFSATNPLWVARYASTAGTLPGGWPYYTFWQYRSSPVDSNQFSADYARLKVLADGG